MERTKFKLKATPPFDFISTITQWGVHPPLEYLVEGVYYSVIRLPSGKLATLSMCSRGEINRPLIEIVAKTMKILSKEEKMNLEEKIRWQLGVDENINEFYDIVKEDAILKLVVKNLYGMRVHASSNLFYTLALSIALQNAPIARSRNMLRLLTQRFGQPSIINDLNIFAFPAASEIAKASINELLECKWGYRSKYLKNAANAVLEDDLRVNRLKELHINDVIQLLCKIKGIGKYSAEIVALDALRKYNTFPLDSWSSKIFSELYFGTDDVSVDVLNNLAHEKWGKYRGLAFVYIFNDLENLSKRSQ
jgi:3-methyladenine DNA glycosylase/8-oxoguanine DNA glycosylase